jgi:hypothetical protein
VESFSPCSPLSVAPARRIATVENDIDYRRKEHYSKKMMSLLYMSITAIGSTSSLSMPMEDQGDEENDMEWIEEEFELLTERDFYNTEWKIGTLMDDKPRVPKNIDTTWVRLVTTEDGTNKAIWGDGANGKWTIDVPSQFFSISKESFGGWLGKRIWAGTINDFYYLEGTVRGWSPVSPASVVGGWQAIRLGIVEGERVTEEERGVAPWFETSADDTDDEGDEGKEIQKEGGGE